MKLNWQKVDWSKSTTEIMKETGASQVTVSRARRRLAPETVGASRVSRWNKVDWTKGTKQISKELGVASQLVSTWRARLAPETLDANVIEARTRGRIRRVRRMEEEILQDPEGGIFL